MTPKYRRPAPVAGGRGAIAAGSDVVNIDDSVRIVDLNVGDLRAIVRVEITAALGTPEKMLEQPLVDTHAVAHDLGISVATLDRKIRVGLVPFCWVGDRKKFDLAAVRAALETSAAAKHATKTPEQGSVRLLSRGQR